MTREPDRWVEERLHLAIEAGRLGTWEWDIVGERVSWSPHLEAIHGVPVGSFDGTFEAWKRDIHPQDLERVLTSVGLGLEQRTGHNIEYRIIRPDGHVRWLEVRSRLQCGEDGRPVFMLGVCMDVTERKQAEEARDLLFGILGHDLRNPLQAIRLASTILLEQALPVDALKKVATISRSSERIEHIVRDLLDFARGRFGQGLPVTRSRCSMDAIARGVIDELAIANPERPIELHVHGDVSGQWDAERLGQVISNLVGNALAHGRGGVAVRLEGGETEVTLSVTNKGDVIPESLLPMLFQPFYSRAPSKQGLGLGLFIVNEIVRAHGARISVSSSQQDGTHFAICWPRGS